MELIEFELPFCVSDLTILRWSLSLATLGSSYPGLAESEAKKLLPATLPIGARGYILRGVVPEREPNPSSSRGTAQLRYVLKEYLHCTIDLALGLDAYKAKFSSKTRSTLQRKVRRLAEHCGGELRCEVYKTPEEMFDFHEKAREVSTKTYQERLLDAGIPNTEDFKRGMQRRAKLDSARGYLLFAKGRPISYLYCPIEDGVVQYAYLGYDPEFSPFSAGTVLFWLAIEHLFTEKKFRVFDFTEGQSEHKLLFSTHQVVRANVLYLQNTVALRFLLTLHAGLNDVVCVAGQFLHRWGLKARLRRLLRFGWRSA